MSFRTRFVSSLLSLTVATIAVAGAIEPAAAKKLSKGEVAAIAGVGGFVLGLGIANANRGPYYDSYRSGRSAWEDHVDRCYDHYRTYDENSDTYIGFDGQLHYCRL